MRPLLRFQAALAVAALAFVRADAAPGEAIVPVRLVAGKMVVFCDVSTSARRIPVNLFVELETPCGLRLHNRAAGPLRAESADGKTRPITLHLPGRSIVVERREHGPEKEYEAFTKYWSKELGENAVVGSIGAHVLRDHHLVLDLAQERMILSDPRAGPADPDGPDATPGPSSPSSSEEEEGTRVVPITINDDVVWVPVRDSGGDPAAMAITTSTWDTVVDHALCSKFGRPAGEIGALRVGDIDLAKYVAFRPETVARVHKDGVAGTIGLNALKHLRVEIDRTNRVVKLTETAPPEFPVADRAFFAARAEDEIEPLVAYLDAYPDSRLASDAARLLLDLQLDEDSPQDVLRPTLRAYVTAYPEDLRATAADDLMLELLESGVGEAIIPLGEIGIESGRKDRYPNAVHQIHARLGHVLLERDAGKRAWKHLLSAAFGLPEDGMVNLDLGRFYESQGRHKRAFSRYVQAVIKPESGEAALKGLERTQRALDGEERMSVDTIERLIAGKVLSFGTAAKYTPPEDAAGRVTLVELFTNAHGRGTLAGELAFEGLKAHFERRDVALLSYQLPTPALVPLVNDLSFARAAQLGIESLEFRIDGTNGAPAVARKDQREKLYEYCRDLVKDALTVAPDVKLTLEVRRDGDRVHGRVIIDGEARWGRVVHVVLAEKAVLFPGKNEVPIHRMIARGSLIDSLGGIPFAIEDGEERMTIPFDVKLSAVAATNRTALDELVAAGEGSTVDMAIDIDPEQVTVVAFVHDVRSNRVLQAVQLDPTTTDETP